MAPSWFVLNTIAVVGTVVATSLRLRSPVVDAFRVLGAREEFSPRKALTIYALFAATCIGLAVRKRRDD